MKKTVYVNGIVAGDVERPETSRTSSSFATFSPKHGRPLPDEG